MAKETWKSPIYSFFKSEVTIEVHKGHIAHFFTCYARLGHEVFGVFKTHMISLQLLTFITMQFAASVRIQLMRL